MEEHDTQRPRLGITYLPNFEPDGLLAAARAADAAGLDELWLWEDCFRHGGISTTAAALAATDRLTVGLGLMPVPMRNVAVTAMEVATLHRMFPGRMIAGIGHGTQRWMGQIGARVQSPLTLLSEYHTVLRSLLDGETVDFDGRYLTIEDVQLRWPPATRVPIMVGGVGPKTLGLAARIGDGNLLTAALSREEIESACRLIADELTVTSKDPASHEISAILIVATGEDADRRLDAERARWRRAGVQGVGVAGDADVVADEVRALARLGVTRVAVQPTEDEPDLPGLMSFLGRRVMPLIGSYR